MKKKYLIISFLSFISTIITLCIISTIVLLFVSRHFSNPDADIELIGEAIYFMLAVIILLLPTLQMFYFLSFAHRLRFFFERRRAFYVWVYVGFNIAFWSSTAFTYFVIGKGLLPFNPFTPIINGLLIFLIITGFLTLIFLIYFGILYFTIFPLKVIYND